MIAIASGIRTSPLAWLFGCLLCLTIVHPTFARANDLQSAFENPPPNAAPWAFWYWNKGAISRTGITADLEAMRDAGIGGAYLMSIKGPDPQLWDQPVVQLTPEWWDMVRHAFREADRLGLEIAMHDCDGFATAGGPWITPEKSMQKLVWSETRVTDSQQFDGKLSTPATNEGYYCDIAVFAIPVHADANSSLLPRVTTSLPDFDAQFLATTASDQRLRLDEPGWVQYEYNKAFTCRTITIHPDGNSFQANRLLVSVSDDGQNFRDLVRLEPPRHGWQNGTGSVTHAIPATTAKFFRLTFDPAGTEPGAEDLDSAKWKPTLKIRGIELGGQPRLHQSESKNGQVWRVSRRTTEEQVSNSDCVSLETIVNITKHLQSDGTLTWKVPAGEWLILRMGHTSTGTHNETGGGGRGLECDKFNPKIVQLQFDRWFGEIIRQIGPKLTHDVLKGFHVDSWECGSQNWSSVFPAEFQRRLGYDLTPYLPVLAGIPITSANVSERILFDVRQTITDLIVDNFFGTLAKLSHAHGCRFSAECVAPTMMSDGMRHFGSVDLPMGEFWLRSPTHDKPNDMLDAISAAHIYGKPIVQAEAFTELRMAWDEHPGLIKALGDRQLCLGANRFVYHVFNHNPWLDRQPGMTLDPIGLYFQRDQTWWSAAKAWVDYHKRCQAMLQAGEPVVDIAVFTGEDIPARAVLPESLVTTLPGIVGKEAVAREKIRLANIGTPLRELPRGVSHSANMSNPADWIDPLRGYAYDSVNPDALLRLATVKEGRLELPGGASYRLLVLPVARPLSPHPELQSPAVAKQLSNFVAEGATVIDSPIQADSFAAHGIEPDFLAFTTQGQRLNNIAWNHRRSDDADWYFVSNQSDSAQEVIVSLRENGKQPEIWDPLTGEIQAANKWSTIKGRTVFPLQLEPSGSLFIVLRDATELTGRDDGTNWREFKEIKPLSPPWTVEFDARKGGPSDPIEFAQLADWSQHADDKIRHYSGTAVYRHTFDWNNSAPRVWLDLGQVANLAEVRVNNIACGFAWTPPYRVEITDALREGTNKLEIAITNTWANRLIGDARLPPEQRVTWTTAPSLPADAKLLPAGLFGPVRLLRENQPPTQPEK